MSDVLFPISVSGCEVTPVDRVDTDEFESGSSAVKRWWPVSYFRHQISVTTPKLTLDEWRYLRTFYGQRGTWDSFWFRDNVGRSGNYQVRFAKAFAQVRDPVLYSGQIELIEAAPRRVLPEFDEVMTAAGGSSLVSWFDPNRDWVSSDQGIVRTDSQLWDVMGRWPARDVNGTLSPSNYTGQYQYYAFSGAGDQFAVSATPTQLATGVHPVGTVFAFVKSPASNGDQQVILSVGTDSTNRGMGIQFDGANYFKPWIGSVGTWTTAKFLNSPASTWRSVAASWNGSGDVGSLVVNGALVGADFNTRNYLNGPIGIGGTPAGTFTGEQPSIAHMMIFSTQLSVGQVKAIHNLLCYQFGLATV